MNNGQMDRGNENPTQHLPWWLRKTTKNPPVCHNRPWRPTENVQSYIQWRRAHSPKFQSLHLRHNSFSNPSVALPTSRLILQPFRCFTYVTANYPTLRSLYLHHGSFSNLSITPPTPQLILQPFRRFTYITAHSPTFPSLQLRHSSFSNPSVALPRSRLILQTFRCFTYVTAYSPTLLSLHLRHRLFTYVTWRAAHVSWGKSARQEHYFNFFRIPLMQLAK